MATLSFSCPKCGKLHERVNSGMVGFKVQCKCGFVFRLGSKDDKNEDFGEIIRKKKELKRKTAEAAVSVQKKIGKPTFDLLPKFDPLDPNRDDITSPSNEIQSPITPASDSEVDDSGSMELDDFPLPPPVPENFNQHAEPDEILASQSNGASPQFDSMDIFPEEVGSHKGTAVRSAPQPSVVDPSQNKSRIDASIGTIPEDLLADMDADSEDVTAPDLPSSNGVIREPSKVVKGRHKPVRKKANVAADGTGSVLFSCIGLALSVILTPIYLFIMISGIADALFAGIAIFTIVNLCVSSAVGFSLLINGIFAVIELVKSKLYLWPWIIQGGLAGVALIWGCVQCGVAWQSGSDVLSLLLIFFLVGLAPLLLLSNSLARLIFR
ncbi:MAG: hypothetical protein OSA89_03055 [Mariniblastus sp.]|nr:hypothetical protein [Mariniblastus sp.]